jgi:hypothetical protein
LRVRAALALRHCFEHAKRNLIDFWALLLACGRGCAMRLAIPALCGLFLYTGATAFCQSATNLPAKPDRPGQTSLVIFPSARDFNQLPSGWQPLNPMSLPQPKVLLVPAPQNDHPLNRSRIDPKMIVHPPQSSLGVQPPGTIVAQNEYPNLRIQPIDSARSAVEAIPTNWPALNVQTIPNQWPGFKLSGSLAAPGSDPHLQPMTREREVGQASHLH